MNYPYALCWLTALTLSMLSQNIFAGKLNSFEESATQENPSKSHRKHNATYNACDDQNNSSCLDDNDYEYFFLKIIGGIFAYGGSMSLGRVIPFINQEMNNPSSLSISDNSITSDEDFPFKLAPRKIGEPLIPFARVDISKQYISSNIRAHDTRFELGFGPLAVHHNYTRFTESPENDKLELSRTYGLYRMSFGSYVEVDIGMGRLILEGNRRSSQFFTTLPILIHPSKTFGLEFKPAWTDNIRDYDLSLLASYRYLSLKFGYRWLKAGNTSLNGPYTGMSAHF